MYIYTNLKVSALSEVRKQLTIKLISGEFGHGDISNIASLQWF